MGDEDLRFEIGDFETLNWLSRALVEAKFHADPNDPDVPANERLAALATRVADAVDQETQQRYPGIGRAIDGWRDPREQPEMLAVVRRRLQEATAWEAWSADERRAFVRTLLAPLHPLEQVVDTLVAERDRLASGA